MDGDPDYGSGVAERVVGAELAGGTGAGDADVGQSAFAAAVCGIGSHGVFQEIADAVLVEISGVTSDKIVVGLSAKVLALPLGDGIRSEAGGDGTCFGHTCHRRGR